MDDIALEVRILLLYRGGFANPGQYRFLVVMLNFAIKTVAGPICIQNNPHIVDAAMVFFS